ncbi:MAG: helix-turn-helix transcriptional regulator [Gammaproteobacteria bacterium]|nr:helix-turn-helix transcriptional regulator [Gammaproteobacteria bacterium]
MQFSIFEVLLLVGIIQGLVAVPLLLFSKNKQLSNVFLAFAILTFCLLFIKIIMNYSGLLNKPNFRYLPNAFEMATAPLLYFYFLALTEKGFRWQSKYLLHFIPLALAQGFALFIYFQTYDLATLSLQDKAVRQLNYNYIKEIENWLIVISILSYLFVGARKFLKFQQRVKDNTANSAYPTLRWLKTIIGLSAILISFLIINMLIGRFTSLENTTEIHWKLYFIYQAALTYYLGFMAYHQQPIDLNEIYPEDSSNTQQKPEEDVSDIIEHLELQLTNEKVYLDPSLNISQLAKTLEINSANLSQIINAHYGKSFRSLINDYRIEDIKEKLLTPDNKASILSLALESGFNSEASFYRIFKNSTGITPKAFIQNNNR